MATAICSAAACRWLSSPTPEPDRVRRVNRLTHTLLSFALGALLISSALPRAVAQVAPFKETPRVTVVLAGGGAKGFAHLALLRRLEQDHIQIAKIIGTSMGAVIGSLYASGMSTQQIEKIIASE